MTWALLAPAGICLPITPAKMMSVTSQDLRLHDVEQHVSAPIATTKIRRA